MSRRIGALRLNSLNKQGRSVTGSMGTMVSGAVGHRRIMRSGDEITTEIYVDLGSSKGALYSGAKAGSIIGHSGSLTAAQAAASASYANLTQLTLKENGVITLAEMTCVEAPTGGNADIDLVYASGLKAFSGSSGTSLLAAGGNLVLGSENAAALDANELKDQYLYLQMGDATSDTYGTANKYTAGKLLIRLYGHAVPDDV